MGKLRACQQVEREAWGEGSMGVTMGYFYSFLLLVLPTLCDILSRIGSPHFIFKSATNCSHFHIPLYSS